MNQQHSHAVGIDPGERTGIAYWHLGEQRLVQLETLKPHELITEIVRGNGRFDPNSHRLVIEDANLNAPVFDNGYAAQLHKAIQRKDIGFGLSLLKRAMKQGSNVGRVKQTTRLVLELARVHGFDVRPVRPRTQKVDAEYFKRVTGYSGRTNQHVRDAAMLVIGL